MITECTPDNLSNILNVINDAALKYKGVIPEECWQLIHEFGNGGRIFGYASNSMLVGVMGIQQLEDVTLIRHAYTLSDWQGIGIGKSLLQYLFGINESPRLLVGTWQDATWAIRFYEKNGFFLHGRTQTDQLLKTYWQIPSKQMENSVVLEKLI